MAWCVNQGDGYVLPRERNGGGVDSDAALLLFFVEVSFCGAFVDFTEAMRCPGAVEHSLCHRRLTGIDVSDDADVSECLQFASHLGALFASP